MGGNGLIDPNQEANGVFISPRQNRIALDLSREFVTPGCDPVFRLFWEIEYRNGERRCQYERIDDRCVQTYFARIEKRGVRWIIVHDMLRRGAQYVLRVEVPDFAEADILYNCATVDFQAIHRVFTFGWRNPLDHAHCFYVHIDPTGEPFRIMNSTRRLI